MTLTILFYTAITLHIVACLFLISVILLQQGKGQDLASAFGGGGSQAAFGPRGSANMLSRTTTILAGVFMVTSLGLSLLRPQQRSVFDQLPEPAASAPAPAPAAPGASAPAPAPATTTAPAPPPAEK